jgi:hypothetical protein
MNYLKIKRKKIFNSNLFFSFVLMFFSVGMMFAKTNQGEKNVLLMVVGFLLFLFSFYLIYLIYLEKDSEIVFRRVFEKNEEVFYISFFKKYNKEKECRIVKKEIFSFQILEMVEFNNLIVEMIFVFKNDVENIKIREILEKEELEQIKVFFKGF